MGDNKEQDNRIFVGGLAFDVTERQLESAFSRFGKILDCQVMLERDTGRPRGFGFLTFADSRAMEDAIRDMHGRELGDRAISVNKAQPKMASEEPAHGYRGGYSSGGGRGGYDKPAAGGQDDCFKCGRPGHWARDCPSGGGGGGRGGGRPFSPPRSTRYAGVAVGARGDRYAGDRSDRYIDDRSDRGRYGDRDRYDNRDDRYGARDRYVNDRYPPAVERFPVDRYGASERYPPNGYGKDRAAAYDREGGGPAPRGVVDRYVGGGGGGGPAGRYEGRSYNNRERPGPYDRPRRGGGGRPPSLDRY